MRAQKYAAVLTTSDCQVVDLETSRYLPVHVQVVNVLPKIAKLSMRSSAASIYLLSRMRHFCRYLRSPADAVPA